MESHEINLSMLFIDATGEFGECACFDDSSTDTQSHQHRRVSTMPAAPVAMANLTSKGGMHKLDLLILLTEAGRWRLARYVVGDVGNAFDLVDDAVGDLLQQR